MTGAAASDPWSWALPAALAFGLGVGRLLVAAARGRARAARGASVQGLVLLSLAVLAGTGFLVFPPKAALAEPLLAATGGILAGLGLLSGLLPRAFGIPLLVLASSIAGFLFVSLEGWVRVDSPRPIATLTPFEVGPTGSKGEFSVEERDSVPIIQGFEVGGRQAGLVIERLELSGPLGLLAGRHRYRITGLSAPDASGLPRLAEAYGAPSAGLDLLLPLGEGLSAEARMAFADRYRESLGPLPLEALVPLRFSLDPGAPSGKGLLVRRD